MMASEKLRARQESTDSLENTESLEDYSDDDKDLALEDFKFIKTIGKFNSIFCSTSKFSTCTVLISFCRLYLLRVIYLL